MACLPKHRNSTMCSDEPPMILTQTCSHWRNVALIMPRLWAAIHIPIPGFRGGTSFTPEAQLEAAVERPFTGIKAFLSRSGSLPLRISTHFEPWDKMYAHSNALLDCIIPLAARWKDVDFVGPSRCLSQIRELQSESHGRT
ncbi:hypothetical protein M413DRAFT_238363, partial [Hebeloma cylindrosporum]